MKKYASWLESLGITTLVGIVIYYLALPAINLRSIKFWLFLILLTILFFGIPIAKSNLNQVKYVKDSKKFEKRKITICIAIPSIISLVFLIGLLTGAPIFNAKKYHNIIKIEEGNFNEDITAITNNAANNLVSVDMSTAKKLGDRTLGSVENSSYYEVDQEYNMIEYQGEYYRISVLNYGSAFKYLKAKNTGIPGYVLVNATTQEAKFVSYQGIKYSPSAYFSYNLKRYLRSKYASDIFGKSYFEIDEMGKPYWITPIETPSIGLFGGKVEKTFIVTDACTGECTQ